MTQAAILAASGSPGTTTGFKNRIINGGMAIAQRGTGTTSSAFVNQVDMFQVATNAMSFTFGQNTDAPTGFSKSGLVTNTSAVTPSATQYFSIRGVIEGLNVADLGWGTASAKTVTLSFWVKSSLTGTFGGAIVNGPFNYSYPFSYTISSANTWEQKSVTIAGPTAGTWQTDNNVGMYLEWALGTGSTYQGTAGSWAATRYQGVTGQTQLSQTNGATFQLTGVQFEVGTTATNFDFRSYGTELNLCQRYYTKLGVLYGYCMADTTTMQFTAAHSVMRTDPSATMLTTTPYAESYPSITARNGSSASAANSLLSQYGQSFVRVSGFSGLGAYQVAILGANQVSLSAEL